MRTERGQEDPEMARAMGSVLALPAPPPGGFGALLVDPPWRFANATGKVAPGHRRLWRYATLPTPAIAQMDVGALGAPASHLYLWAPCAFLPDALGVMASWGYTFKTTLVWYKVRADGGPDGRGVGFYFRTVTEMCLFGTRGRLRTLAPGRRQVNLLATRKREHSRKPDELYGVIEACSPGPRCELFARTERSGWTQWGTEVTWESPRGEKFSPGEKMREVGGG